jgi:hypothetical protein
VCDGHRILPAFGILLALLLLARFILVVSCAAPTGLALAVGFPTSEGTAQVPTLGIPWVGEKENPAVPTTSQAPAQIRLGTANRSQQRVIRKNQADHRAGPIPIHGKSKILPDLDCINPSTWLWTLK